MGLPTVQLSTIETCNAQSARTGESYQYLDEISKRLDKSQPHMKSSLVGSVCEIMQDLGARGLDQQTCTEAGAAILSLCYMVIQSIEAEVEIQELENG